MNKIIILIVAAGAFTCTSIGWPKILSENRFLATFVSHEVLSLLAVILTVTLASVANIYISLNKVIASKFDSSEEARKIADAVKREIKEDCYYIAASFAATSLLLIIKGSISADNKLWMSLLNGAVLWFLLLSLMCMLDVYQVAFGIASKDDVVKNQEEH